MKQITITDIGQQIIQEKINAKSRECLELMEEIRLARESCSSNDDIPEVAILTNRYETVLGEKAELIETLSKANIIDVTKLSTDKVTFGVVVTVLDCQTEREATYRVVSPIESDISKGMISYESPLGKSMIGCRIGDVFDFDVRGKTQEFEIVNIEVRSL